MNSNNLGRGFVSSTPIAIAPEESIPKILEEAVEPDTLNPLSNGTGIV